MEPHYYRTLIAVADDCPVSRGTPPSARGDKPTVAALQYRMLADHPFRFTQPEVLFDVWLERQALGELPEAERARLHAAFFAKPQACLRASPLPKQYGWGLLFDEAGRIALCPMESPTYQELIAGGQVQVRKAMRSRRA